MAIIETVRKVAKLKGAIPPEKIETSGRIGAIIGSISQGRGILEVSIGERRQIFTSSQILDIGKYKGNPCLIVDTLIPKLEGIRALEGIPASRLLVGFRFNDVPHTFASIFHVMSEENSPTVTISYPKVVFSHQFRGAYRISPTMGESIYVNIEALVKKKQDDKKADSPNTDSEEAEESQEAENPESEETEKFQEQENPVEDISIDGLSFFTKNPNMTKGTEIFLDFEVPGIGHFESNAVVMSLIRRESSKYPFKCGIKFEDMANTEKELIYRFIMTLQRQELKKKQGIT